MGIDGGFRDQDGYDDDGVPMSVEQAEQIVQGLREIFAEDEALAAYGYPDGGVRVHIELDDDGRAHVGLLFHPAAGEAFARLLDSGFLGDLTDPGAC